MAGGLGGNRATGKGEEPAGLMPNFQSPHDFIASFAFKDGTKNAESPTNPPRPTALLPSQQSKTKKEEDEETKKKNNKKRRKKKQKNSTEEEPSSCLRTTIGGKTMVVSKYFPLPPTATPPVVIGKRKVLKAFAARNKIPLNRRRKAETPLISHRGRRRRKQLSDHDINSNTIEPEQQQEQEEEKKKKKKKMTAVKQRSLLSAKEKKLDAYRRVADDNTWEPPASCYNLLQERHSFDPWRVLLICMLLNLTTGNQVKRVLRSLFRRCPNAEAATKIPEEELVQLLQPLGLHRKRARAIKRFSCEYLGDEWTHVTQLPGVGKYAADAYAIFCVGRPEDVTPEDHKLVDYWKFVCEKRAQEQQQCVGESAQAACDGNDMQHENSAQGV